MENYGNMMIQLIEFQNIDIWKNEDNVYLHIVYVDYRSSNEILSQWFSFICAQRQKYLSIS